MKNPGYRIFLVPLVLFLILVAAPIWVVVLLLWSVLAVVISFLASLLRLSRGIRYLVVYSESEQWEPYFRDEVVPAFGRSARVINLSKDGGTKRWWHLDWFLYKYCGGYRNRFPIIVRFSWFGPWKTIRFYEAYMQSKKGDSGALNKAKSDALCWFQLKS